MARGWARRGTAEQAATGVPAPGQEEAEMLAHLVAALDLRPWPDVLGRLDELSRAREGKPVR